VTEHLLGPAGRAALFALLRRRPLLAFDFDGTLAPIAATPDDVRIGEAMAWKLRRLMLRFPIAIVTGRSVADVRDRLGFDPTFVVGNHGAEDGMDADAAERRARALDPVRATLATRAAELDAAGVTVEEKEQSLALHYRLAPDRARAVDLVRQLTASFGPEVHTFAGKMVENIVLAAAADKGQAVLSLVARCLADSAFFAGDDVNDEPVFDVAGERWLTVRVGRSEGHSRARFFVAGQCEMPLVLDEMIRHC